VSYDNCDDKLWFVTDDTGILHEGGANEMIRAFNVMSGVPPGWQEVTEEEKRKYSTTWQGTLRLLRQQSCMSRQRHSAAARQAKLLKDAGLGSLTKAELKYAIDQIKDKPSGLLSAPPNEDGFD